LGYALAQARTPHEDKEKDKDKNKDNDTDNDNDGKDKTKTKTKKGLVFVLLVSSLASVSCFLPCLSPPVSYYQKLGSSALNA
jgi:hypothetical protein